MFTLSCNNPKESTLGRKRHGITLASANKKLPKLGDKELFDPRLFGKGNTYDGIIDSSDSDSDDNCEKSTTSDSQSTDDSDSRSTDDSDSDSADDSDSRSTDDSDSDSDSRSTDSSDCGSADDSDSDSADDSDSSGTNPIIKLVVKSLKEKFPEAVVSDTVGKQTEDEYYEPNHKDSSWKKELGKAEVNALEGELKQLRRNIRESTPTIPKILRCGLSSREKERALQLYDVLSNTEPYTLDHMYLSTKIGDMIKCAPEGLDPETSEELKILREKMEAETPTVEKIMGARITESDKIKALQFYEVMQQCGVGTEEWFDTRHGINRILGAQLGSSEEVSKLEEEEEQMKDLTSTYHADLKRKIFELDADLTVKSRIFEMYTDMTSRGVSDSRYSDLKEKIMWAIKLPHRRTSSAFLLDKTPEGIRNYCNTIYNRLNSEIYGMKEAKEKVIQAVNDRIYNPNSRCILALKGRPGVGKTMLAKTIAKASGLPFDKISLGGAIDSTIFKGSDNVWSGASPSMLLQILSRVKYSNAVILLDEIDKLSTSQRGLEVQHALLHILDPTQSSEFQDSFLNEFHHDISKIWFIPAMNDDSRLDPALRDRLNIIEVPSYTHSHMIQIIKRHTLPNMLLDKGIEPTDVTITDDAAQTLLSLLGASVKDTGMRPVERSISDIVSKINLLRTFQDSKHPFPLTFHLADFKGLPYTITSETVRALVKPRKSGTPLLPMYR